MPLKLRPAFHKATGLNLDRKIYSGNGEIYTIRDHKDKVVKVVCAGSINPSKEIKFFKYLKRNKNPAIVKLFQIGALKIRDDCYSYYCYYYVMERLKLMPPKMMYNDFGDLAEGVCGGSVPGGARKSIQTFVKNAKKIKYKYGDLHEYNVMRSKNGSLKFVDLESFYF